MSRLFPALSWLAFCLASAAVALTLLVFAHAWYPVLLQDEWVGLGHYFQRGFWPSIFCAHNHHVVIVPKLFSRLSYLLTGADPLFRGALTLASAALGGLVLGCAAMRALRDRVASPPLAAALFMTCVAFFTWLVSYQQLFWGMATYTYFSILFGLGSLATCQALADRRFWPGILPVYLLALLSTASFSYGAATWGALAILMYLQRKPVPQLAITLLAGAAVFVGLRWLLPPCDRLAMPVPTELLLAPGLLLKGLAATAGNAWVLSLAPLFTPSIEVSVAVGIFGLLLLAALTLPAVAGRAGSGYRLLVSCGWLAFGMLLLVCVGRGAAFVDYPSQMIAARFVPLSAFLWVSLAATSCCHLCARPPGGSLAAAALLSGVALYLVFSSLLTVFSLTTFRFGPGNFHLSYNEYRLEAIRSWVGRTPEDRASVALSLAFVDVDSLENSIDELQSRRWDFFRSLPVERFPSSVDALRGDDAATPAPGRWKLRLDKLARQPGTTWRVSGTLPEDLPDNVRHIFLGVGETVVGYAVPTAFPAFQNNAARGSVRSWPEVVQRIREAGDRLVLLLAHPKYWHGVSRLRIESGHLECQRLREEVLLCDVSPAG